MDKVKVVANDEFESLFPKFQPSRVTITTTSGNSLTKRVDVPKGDPRDPMTEEEIGVKFRALGEEVIGREGCAALSAAILSLETLADVRRLTALSVARS
jgi:2-methylcitrate dehydratase